MFGNFFLCRSNDSNILRFSLFFIASAKIIKLGKLIVSVEGRLMTFSGKIAASGLHTAVLTKTSDINKSQ